MIQAVKDHDIRDWDSAINQMVAAYKLIKDKTKASFDPTEVARQEVGWWELHDKLEFVDDKTPLAEAFAKLFALVFEVSEGDLEKAGKLKAEATRQHDLAEEDGVNAEDEQKHWKLAEEKLVRFYEELKSATNE